MSSGDIPGISPMSFAAIPAKRRSGHFWSKTCCCGLFQQPRKGKTLPPSALREALSIGFFRQPRNAEWDIEIDFCLTARLMHRLANAVKLAGQNFSLVFKAFFERYLRGLVRHVAANDFFKGSFHKPGGLYR